jgi:endonuclease/exonuclease/phosphatase family metal-dependent hydrolase
MGAPFHLRVCTYNVHSCIGIDGQFDPKRVAGVLQEIGADIIGLQEVDTSLSYEPVLPAVPDHERRHTKSTSNADTVENGTTVQTGALPDKPLPSHQLDYLVKATGYTAVNGLIREKKTGLFGNVLLTRYKVLAVRRVDLTIRGGRQRRGALDVDLDVNGETLRVFVAHLGLGLWERHFQINRLLKVLGQDRQSRILMMGDFNLWVSLFPKLRRLHRRLGHIPLVTSYPSIFPLLSLDRIWLQPKKNLSSVYAHTSALSRVASDHLPLVGAIEF